MKLHFVTSNKGKVEEAKMILDIPVEVTALHLPEIQSLDMEEIVKEKALHAYQMIKQPLFVDDAGLFINAWNGFPGPFVKFLAQAGGNDLLLRMMRKESNRNAVLRAAIGYHDGVTTHTFVGEVAGTIATIPKGEKGWGFDPIFIPNNALKTFAEMMREEKNAISHRRNALKKFKEFLDDEEIGEISE